MTDVLVNGDPDARIAPDDRGLLYGDGLFETIAFHHGRSVLWAMHMARLGRDCRRLGFPAPDPDLLADECARLVRDHGRAVVRITLTRGRGGRGYFPAREPSVTRIVQRRPMPPGLARQRRDGLSLHTARTRLPGARGDPEASDDSSGLAGIKHLGRLEQVLVARECAENGSDEALVLDPAGEIIEGLAGNVVIVREDRMIAPGPHPSAVAGIGLDWLRRRAGDRLCQRGFRREELGPGDSVWVINSVRGPCPACRLDGRSLERDGLIGRWQTAWREEIEE